MAPVHTTGPFETGPWSWLAREEAPASVRATRSDTLEVRESPDFSSMFSDAHLVSAHETSFRPRGVPRTTLASAYERLLGLGGGSKTLEV